MRQNLAEFQHQQRIRQLEAEQCAKAESCHVGDTNRLIQRLEREVALMSAERIGAEARHLQKFPFTAWGPARVPYGRGA